MFCHPATRIKLLKADLWWAVMRLAKTDSTTVRDTCARAVYDLSGDEENVLLLRKHHIFSFLKNVLSSGCSESFLESTVRAVTNIVHLVGRSNFLPFEIVSILRIAIQVRVLPSISFCFLVFCLGSLRLFGSDGCEDGMPLLSLIHCYHCCHCCHCSHCSNSSHSSPLLISSSKGPVQVSPFPPDYPSIHRPHIDVFGAQRPVYGRAGR